MPLRGRDGERPAVSGPIRVPLSCEDIYSDFPTQVSGETQLLNTDSPRAQPTSLEYFCLVNEFAAHRI